MQTVTRKQVIELAKIMPLEKLMRWYEYGLFIQSRPTNMPEVGLLEDDEQLLIQEFAEWEAASDEDWLKLEHDLIGYRCWVFCSLRSQTGLLIAQWLHHHHCLGRANGVLHWLVHAPFWWRSSVVILAAAEDCHTP